MKFSLSLLSIYVLSFILIYGCSTEEEESVAPVVQTPQPEAEPDPVEYSLTVSATSGGTVSSEGGTYEEGTEVTITATPAEGYEFVGWEGSDSTNETLTITLNSNQTIQAQFELNSSSTINDSLESNVFASSDVNQQEKQVVINALETVMDIFEVDIPMI